MAQLTIFAKRLKEARSQAGLKQRDLAGKASITTASISAYESSDGTKGKNPTLENAKALAEALNVSLDWLCDLKITQTTEKANGCAEDFFANGLIYATEILDEESFIITCDNGGQDNCAVLEFRSREINEFLKNWKMLITLRKNRVMQKDLYDSCLSGIISDFSKKMSARAFQPYGFFEDELIDELFPPDEEKRESDGIPIY